MHSIWATMLNHCDIFLLYIKYQYLVIYYPWCDLYTIHKKGVCPPLLPETWYGSTYWFFHCLQWGHCRCEYFPFVSWIKWNGSFFKFKDYLLMFKPIDNFIITLFICSISLSGHFPERNRFESSANRRRDKTSETLDISSIYNRNNNGPRMDPWGFSACNFLMAWTRIIVNDMLFSIGNKAFTPHQWNNTDAKVL